MTNYGMLFSDERGVNFGDRAIVYRSDLKRWQVNTAAKNKHLDQLEMAGGTALAPALGVFQQEDLLVIPHGYKFAPEFLIYFFVIDAPGSSRVGYYFIEGVEYSTDDDKIYGDSDENNFYIRHSLTGQSGYTSPADMYRFRVKYMILNIPRTRRVFS